MKKAANRKRPAVNKVYYIYVGILAVLFFIFHTIPFLKGVFYSFTDWRGYGDWNFVRVFPLHIAFLVPDI